MALWLDSTEPMAKRSLEGLPAASVMVPVMVPVMVVANRDLTGDVHLGKKRADRADYPDRVDRVFPWRKRGEPGAHPHVLGATCWYKCGLRFCRAWKSPPTHRHHRHHRQGHGLAGEGLVGFWSRLAAFSWSSTTRAPSATLRLGALTFFYLDLSPFASNSRTS
jgi:hypothetical protein